MPRSFSPVSLDLEQARLGLGGKDAWCTVSRASLQSVGVHLYRLV